MKPKPVPDEKSGDVEKITITSEQIQEMRNKLRQALKKWTL